MKSIAKQFIVFVTVAALSVELVVFVSGCIADTHMQTNDTVGVRTKVPVIVTAEKPTLEPLTADELTAYAALQETFRKKLESNNQKLQTWALQEEAAIRDYNAWAVTSNSLSDSGVHVTPSPVKGQ